MQGDPILRAHTEAERDWMRLLKRQFGREAVFIRNMDAGRGEPGSPLRSAYERYQRTWEYWLDSRAEPSGDARWIRDQR